MQEVKLVEILTKRIDELEKENRELRSLVVSLFEKKWENKAK